MGKLVFLIAFIGILVIGGGLVIWGIGVSNQDQKLRNLFKAQDQVVGEFYGKMFTILKQKAGVADEYKSAFGEIYKDLIAGRYSGAEGQDLMMKWIQESNPTFDPSLYKDLMVSIEGQREGFFIEQKKMTDIVLQHDNLRTLIPTSFILSMFSKGDDLVYVPIIPVDAKKVLETREETAEDLKLF